MVLQYSHISKRDYNGSYSRNSREYYGKYIVEITVITQTGQGEFVEGNLSTSLAFI